MRLGRMTWLWALAIGLGVTAAMAMVIAPASFAQAGLSTGAIQGTVLDPGGAAVTTATVTITSKATGAKISPPVSSTGVYNSGPLAPGDYLVRVEAAGFRSIELPVVVQVGNVEPGTVKMELGSGATTITVEGSEISVNAEQATIQGVITADQIENLPINGRNFLDLAQLEPGVQIQDGGNFDPTKKGFSSISFGGRFGRTARIEVDGLDISDETVGTTTQNVPVNSIKEFQVSQSNLDLATELTSSGTVNITTISGTNTIHGEGFFNYRSDGTSAAIGDPAAQFTRKQYGVNLGGALIKDKLFAFGSWERTTQDLLATASPEAPFDSLRSTFNSPFRDQLYLGRLDYNVSNNIHAFFKFGYEQNLNAATFIPGTYQEFANIDFTPTYGAGIDFSHGTWTHSFRVGYLKFRNGITDAVTGSTIFNPAPLLALAIGNVSTSCTAGGDLFCSGPNILAPQKTYQSNKQFKYDGTKSLRSHTIRYGIGVNRILGGGFASFFGIAPAVRAAVSPATDAFANGDPFGPGGDTNPLNWPVHRIDVGNGEGCFTEIAEFGQKCGGQFDTRFQAYLGDTWKVKSNLTFLYGIRYNRDTGRSDSDLGAIPELNGFQAGLGNPVRQPNKNIGGTLGLAWDPKKDGKTVIRAGAGIYYENGVFNNVLFDRPGRLTTGLFNQVQEACTQGGVTFPDGTFVTSVDGLDIPTQICGDQNAVGNVQTAISDLQKMYQAATISAGPQANGAYFGASNTTANTGSMFAPNFRSPYSIQMNIGFQREIHRGTVLSVDYVRNVGLHTLLGIDQNHQGDASILDTGVATSAIGATNTSFGCPGTDATAINCAIAAGAKIGDYAGNGLTGGTNVTGNFPVGQGAVAFPGKNPDFGQVLLLEPIGRSVYNGLDVVLRSDLKSPVKFVKHINTQISYSLSRYVGQASDGDFVNTSVDFNNPGKYIGPTGLDRKHQFSAGVVMDLPAGIRANFITHYYTALPQTLTFFAPGNFEDIFQYDTNGDGQTGVAPIPGSNVGSFGRDINAGNLNAFLQKYSDKFGGQLTPAGQTLVNAGLFTSDQLQALCAVTPSLNPSAGCASYDSLQLPTAAPGQVNNGNFFTFDLRLGWSIKAIRRWERFRIEPQAAFYNLFNHKNYNGPDNLISGVLDGSSGSVAGIFPNAPPGTVPGGTTKSTRGSFETGLGSGVFAIGAPRSMEFGFKISF
jgi:Carboxypeptidase regulatory-like domain